MFNFLQKFKPLNVAPPPTTDKQEREEREAYLKYILTFRNPEDDERRVAKDLYLLSEYSLVDEDSDSNKLNGYLDKRFVRLHRLYFDDYIKAVQSGKPNSYVTYLNEQDVREGNFPVNLSVLIKEAKGLWLVDDSLLTQKLYSEKVCPQIMNFFGLNTAVNEFVVEDGHYYILSLDFIKPEHFFYRSNGIGKESQMSVGYRASESVDTISSKIDVLKQMICEDFGIKRKPYANTQAIQEDFVKMMLVRSLLIGDSDFCDRNYGFMYNAANHEIIAAPGHDYEFGFSKVASHNAYTKENLDFMIKHYPHVVKEFMDKLMVFVDVNPETKKPYYQDIIEKNVPNRHLAEQFYRMLKVNADHLIFYCLDKVRNFNANQPQ